MIHENQCFSSSFLFSAREYFLIPQHYLLRIHSIVKYRHALFSHASLRLHHHPSLQYRLRNRPASQNRLSGKNKKNPLRQGFSIDRYSLVPQAILVD